MKLLFMPFNKIMEIKDSLKLDEKAIADRVLMEKEGKGLSYPMIASKKKEADIHYRSYHSSNLGEIIKKMLHVKKPDEIFCRGLFECLNIPEMDKRQKIATNYYFKRSDAKSQRGRISKAKTEVCKARYDEAIKYAIPADDNYDETTIEEAIYNTFEYGEVYDLANEEAGLE